MAETEVLAVSVVVASAAAGPKVLQRLEGPPAVKDAVVRFRLPGSTRRKRAQQSLITRV